MCGPKTAKIANAITAAEAEALGIYSRRMTALADTDGFVDNRQP